MSRSLSTGFSQPINLTNIAPVAGTESWTGRPEEKTDKDEAMVRIDGEWVEFSFFRPTARQVHLAGDFNNWRKGELPMVRTGHGYWTARMRLPVGEFKFRYCADGEWFTDFAAFGVEPGRFGLDSIVRVPPRTVRIPAFTDTSTAAAA